MTNSQVKPPTLSIVVVFHNMVREADRTLLSLGASYQSGISATNYEIIAIDNGSNQPLSPERVSELGHNIRYHFLDTKSVSPAGAVNLGVEMARGEFVGVIVDGARMVTPGLVGATLAALQALKNPFVCTLAWHLEPDVQNKSISQGYIQIAEDALLASIDWPANGYGLFDISTLAQSSNVGLLGGMPAECSWFAMPRARFLNMGGFDLRFKTSGGGLMNQDFLNRVAAEPTTNFAVLLDEGSFHQIHGGVATNCPAAEHPMQSFQGEYQSIHGEKYTRPRYAAPYYFGSISARTANFITDFKADQ